MALTIDCVDEYLQLAYSLINGAYYLAKYSFYETSCECSNNVSGCHDAEGSY